MIFPHEFVLVDFLHGCFLLLQKFCSFLCRSWDNKFLFCTEWQGQFSLFAEGQLDMFGSSSIEGWLQIQLSSQVKLPLVNKFFR